MAVYSRDSGLRTVFKKKHIENQEYCTKCNYSIKLLVLEEREPVHRFLKFLHLMI